MSDFRPTAGFALVDFLISALIFLVLGSSVFGLLFEVQRAAMDQADRDQAWANAVTVLQVVEHYLRQVGNDPFGTALAGLEIRSPTEVRLTSDITGSAGPRTPDRGDPDGDIEDAGEDITVRYNAGARRVELIRPGASPTSIGEPVEDFSIEYLDAKGESTLTGDEVRLVKVRITPGSLASSRAGEATTLIGSIAVISRGRTSPALAAQK